MARHSRGRRHSRKMGGRKHSRRHSRKHMGGRKHSRRHSRKMGGRRHSRRHMRRGGQAEQQTAFCLTPVAFNAPSAAVAPPSSGAPAPPATA